MDELTSHQRPARSLRSRKPVGVYGLLVAHHLLRAAMAQAAPAAHLPLRLSFIGILRLIRDLLPLAQLPGQRAPRALQRRAERSNPHVVKQKMTNFRVKTAKHQRWPHPMKPCADAIVLLIYPTFARISGTAGACAARD